jgi:pilus assembly protein Flp/PilA
VFGAFPAALPSLCRTRDERSKEQIMKSVFTRFLRDESGATAIEYGLLAALISVVIIGAVKVVGTKLNAGFNNIANNLS